MTPDVRDRIFNSYPLAARLHCAPPMLLASSVKVSPPPEGFQPSPVSAMRHLPGCFERSRCILSNDSMVNVGVMWVLNGWVKEEGSENVGKYY